MRQFIGLGVGIAAGTVLGAAAVTGLHAQSKPPVYFVGEITVKDPAGYGRDYAPKAQAAIKKYGGKLVALGGSGGAGAQSIKGFDGEPPQRAVIQVWDSMDKLQTWYDSPEMKEARQAGANYATFRTFSLDGVEGM
jgi:uncharacterized protein (DUF1330 family)